MMRWREDIGIASAYLLLQYIRTTELLYCDLMRMPANMKTVLDNLHAFNCELLEKWAKTDVDALRFMDDWGSMKSLLINPVMWREMFYPLYKDYCDIAKRHNKKMFVHSDGNILEIMPDLIEMGVDAINAQIFLMGIENMEKFKGKITFWGEIDRQHILFSGTPEETKEAARRAKNSLWGDGGLIALLEFGSGAKPENIAAAFEAWEE